MIAKNATCIFFKGIFPGDEGNNKVGFPFQVGAAWM